jgi:hypothetical protein
MSAVLDKITRQVLELPRDQRMALASLILDADDGFPATPVEQAWDGEIRRRVAAFDRGEVQGIPYKEMSSRCPPW